MWKGGGGGCKNLIMVTLGTGVGGGIIVGGKILTGAHGAGGEIGHLRVNPTTKQKAADVEKRMSGAVCICNWDYASCKEESWSPGDKEHDFENRNGLSAKTVFDAVKAGDSVAKEIAGTFGNYLGHALANLAAVDRSVHFCDRRRGIKSRGDSSSICRKAISGECVLCK